MEHKLKILPQYFKAVKEGTKTFEIRKNDRDYKVGDTLILKEYEEYYSWIDNGELQKHYTGKETTKEISYILKGGQYGLEVGYCILGLKDKKEHGKEKQEFQLGDTAYFVDEDYRYFESEVKRIGLDKGKYYYETNDMDFELKDIGDWVFTSELYRQIHMENLFGKEVE